MLKIIVWGSLLNTSERFVTLKSSDALLSAVSFTPMAELGELFNKHAVHGIELHTSKLMVLKSKNCINHFTTVSRSYGTNHQLGRLLHKKGSPSSVVTRRAFSSSSKRSNLIEYQIKKCNLKRESSRRLSVSFLLVWLNSWNIYYYYHGNWGGWNKGILRLSLTWQIRNMLQRLYYSCYGKICLPSKPEGQKKKSMSIKWAG